MRTMPSTRTPCQRWIGRGSAHGTGACARALLAFALCWSGALPLIAQEALPHRDQASYDAWKAARVVPPSGPVPEGVDIPTGGRPKGGGCACWIEPDASYTTIDNGTEWNATGFHNADDGAHGPINLPFPYRFHGTNHTRAFVNINGNVSFDSAYTTFSSTGFPVNGYAMVAPFWADVDLRGPGAGNNIVRYKVTPTALYVNWTNVGHYNSRTDQLCSFQLIMTDGSDPAVPNGMNTAFCYRDMQWTTGAASSGTSGFGGVPASVGANRGNGVDFIQFGRFDQAGTLYDGPFGNNDGVDWLDDKYFSFVTDQATGNIPPVVSSQSVCDSMVLCVGQLATLEMTFLSPEPDQTTTCNSTAPTLPGYTIVNNTPGLAASITTRFTPTVADIGFHVITFTGADNGTPPMTTTVTVIAEVRPGGTLPPGSLTVCENGPAVDLLTVLGGTPAPGGSWTGPGGAPHTGQFNPATDPPGDYAYTLSGGTGCAMAGTATITVSRLANAGTDGSLAHCGHMPPEDLFTRLGGNPKPGGVWRGPSGGAFGGVFDPAQHQAGVYRYIVSAQAPCPNDTSAVRVDVAQGVDPGQSASRVLCADAPPLDMRGALGGTPATGGIWTGPGGAPHTGPFNPATDPPGVYTYTVTASPPCPDGTATLTLSVDPAPDAGSDGVLVVCANHAPVALFPQLGGAPHAGGTWEDPLGQPHSGTHDPANGLAGAHVYTVRGLGACTHLTANARVLVTIPPAPVVAFSLGPGAGCAPLVVTFLDSTSTPGDQCEWSFGDGVRGNGCGTVTHTYWNPGRYGVDLTITSPNGCATRLSIPDAVVVDPEPRADFHFTPNPGTEENSTVRFTALDPQAVVFDWRLEGSPFGDQRQTEHPFYRMGTGDYEVCLRVEGRHGCADTLCRTVPIVIPSLHVPNAFTPDGDGVNDVFLPILRDMVPEEYEFQVFDRWGELVFSTRDPAQGWDGRHRSGGGIVQQDVYVWRLTTRPRETSNRLERFGTVTLVR